MNFSKKTILTILFLALVGTIAKAQENNFSHMVTLGVVTPLLQSGMGFHAGYNPGFSLFPFLDVEGQLSYYYAKTVTGSFFSPSDTEIFQSVNLLAGGRLYLAPEEKKARPYVNLLIGGSYNSEAIEHPFQGTSKSTKLAFLAITGAYMNINRFTFGVSTNVRQGWVFKVGYTF